MGGAGRQRLADAVQAESAFLAAPVTTSGAAAAAASEQRSDEEDSEPSQRCSVKCAGEAGRAIVTKITTDETSALQPGIRSHCLSPSLFCSVVLFPYPSTVLRFLQIFTDYGKR